MPRHLICAAAVVAAAASLPATAADQRFDAVSIFGGAQDFNIDSSRAGQSADTSGPAAGGRLRKSVWGPFFIEGEYQFSDLDAYRTGNFIIDQEINRFHVGVGGHSPEDARWIGFWRLDFAGINFSVTESGDGDTEDGFAMRAGVILAAASWCDLSVTGSMLSLDEMAGGEVEAGVSFNVVPEITLDAGVRYTLLENDDSDEFEFVTPRIGATFRFGGPPLIK